MAEVPSTPSQPPAEASFMEAISDPGVRRKLATFDLSRQIGYFLARRGMELDEEDSHLLVNMIGAGLGHEDMLERWSIDGSFPDNTWPIEEWWTHYIDMENTDRDQWAIVQPIGETDGI